MKKSALVMAIATALASSAFAAEVAMYGKVDVGLAFTSVDNGAPDGDRVNTLKMASGQTAGSRWGIRGEEDLVILLSQRSSETPPPNSMR